MTADADFRAGAGCFPIIFQSAPLPRGGIDQAVQSFSSALAKDPNFQRARAWRAYAYVTAGIDGWGWSNFNDARLGSAQDLFSVGLLDAQAAAQGAGTDPRVQYDTLWALAFCHLHSRPTATTDQEMKHRFAKVNFDKALTICRSSAIEDPYFLAETADSLVYLGEVARAEKLINQAIRLARNAGPVPPWFFWVKAWIAYCAGCLDDDIAKFSSAIQSLRKMFKLDSTNNEILPEDFDALVLMAACYREVGEMKLANAAAQQAIQTIQAKKGQPWRWQREVARAPFDPFDGDARELQKSWRNALRELFP